MNKYKIEEEEIKKYVSLCYKVYNEYNWLVNSYVLVRNIGNILYIHIQEIVSFQDFFTQDHWKKLPNTWKEFFVGTEPRNLSNILNVNSDLKLYVQFKLRPFDNGIICG